MPLCWQLSKGPISINDVTNGCDTNALTPFIRGSTRTKNHQTQLLIKMLPHLHSLGLYDNSVEADPKQGNTPQPKLLLHMEAGKVVGPEDPTGAPEWAKPIIAGAWALKATD